MQAITTKFIPATNTRGSRVKASAQTGSITLDWDYRLGTEDNHKAAALALVNKFSWYYGDWIEGHLGDGSSVWVCAHEYHDNSFNLVEETAA
jgi:hypothetical protein